MNPATGTFTTMDTYQGSNSDPITLHKYLYANANPVMNVDPSGYVTLQDMTEAANGMVALDEGPTLNYSYIYHHLVNKIRNITTSYIVKQVLAVALVPFAIYIGAQANQYFRDMLINSALEEVLKNTKSLTIISTINIIAASFIHHAITWAQSKSITNQRYNNKLARHHIVPEGLDDVFMSRIVLSSVGINCYTKSLMSPNIIVIKYSTHYAIHSDNDAYCAFVNSVILTAYCSSISSGYAGQVIAVNAALMTLRTIIRGLDNVIP